MELFIGIKSETVQKLELFTVIQLVKALDKRMASKRWGFSEIHWVLHLSETVQKLELSTRCNNLSKLAIKDSLQNFKRWGFSLNCL